jgi:hypothetical protein
MNGRAHHLRKSQFEKNISITIFNHIFFNPMNGRVQHLHVNSKGTELLSQSHEKSENKWNQDKIWSLKTAMQGPKFYLSPLVHKKY